MQKTWYVLDQLVAYEVVTTKTRTSINPNSYAHCLPGSLMNDFAVNSGKNTFDNVIISVKLDFSVLDKIAGKVANILSKHPCVELEEEVRGCF